jgi:hypothetical protein
MARASRTVVVAFGIGVEYVGGGGAIEAPGGERGERRSAGFRRQGSGFRYYLGVEISNTG